MYLSRHVSHELLSAIDFCTLAQVRMSTVQLSISHQPSGRLRDPPVIFHINPNQSHLCLIKTRTHTGIELSIFPYHQAIMARSNGAVTVAVRCLQSFTKYATAGSTVAKTHQSMLSKMAPVVRCLMSSHSMAIKSKDKQANL